MKSRTLLAGLGMLGLLAWMATAKRPDLPAPAAPKAATPETKTSAPLTSYGVMEEATSEATTYSGVGFKARVDPAGLEFRGDDVYLQLRADRLEQGGRVVSCSEGALDHPAFARSRIDRGVLSEEYAVENRRVEQLFVIPHPIGEGAIRVHVAVQTNLSGPVIEAPRGEGGWKETPLEDGGLAFCDAAGVKKLAYHGAVAIDAACRRIDLDPRHANGQIVLEVPAAFVAGAAFPLTVDPWIEVGFSATAGGVSNTAGLSIQQSLALDALGNPTVAWADTTPGATEIYLRRWNGSAWVELAGSASGGGISANAGSSASPSLALDASGNPVVAWSDATPGTTEIYLKRWNGSAWVQLGGSATAGGVSSTTGSSDSPSLALDASGNPVVAWRDTTPGNSEIYLKRWNGSAWVELGGSATAGGISATAGTSVAPSLALDASGNPVVAWADNTPGTFQIFLRRWTGTAWMAHGTSGSGMGLSATGNDSLLPSLALDASGNPVVSWIDSTGATSTVFLRRWDGGAWGELGGSASVGGLSGASGAGNLLVSKLDLDASGSPVVAWLSVSPASVYLRRWNGSAWVELAGSATGVGIAGNAMDSTIAMRLDVGGNPVVIWEDATGPGTEVFLRRFVQNSPTGLKQMKTDGTTFISAGGLTDEADVVFKGTVSSDPVGGSMLQMRLQVEVRATNQAFTGVPSGESALVASGAEASLTISGLSPGSKQWRARAVDSLGQGSAWVSFGGNADGATDFAAQQFTTVVFGTTDSGGCGLLGLESLLAIALLRRRRTPRR
ncbi:MAG: hypothetical protein HY293_13365 [Planctomycetes bacterium]|nr:hypothetical protein [Planctomycetota bacterium]